MPDDIKINVSVPGAKEAERDLKGVAGAEASVGKAATGAKAAVKDDAAVKGAAAQQTRELDDRNRTLAERMRALGPEFAVLGDTVDAVTMKQGRAAVMVGVLGAAILGVTMLIRKYKEAQAEQKQQAEQTLAGLKEQYNAYLQIADAVEKARQAESAAFRPVGAAGPRTMVEQLLRVGGGLGLGKAGVQTAAQIAGMGPALGDEQARLLAMWVAGGGAEGMQPGQARAMFGGRAQQAEFQAEQRRRAEYRGREYAEGIAARTFEERRMEAGMTPAARTRTILERGAQLRADVGAEQATLEELRETLGRLVYEVRELTGLYGAARARRLPAWAELQDMLQEYPELAEVQLAPDYERLGWQGGRYYPPAKVGAQGYSVGVMIQHINQGTQYNIQDKTDPAGKMVPTMAP